MSNNIRSTVTPAWALGRERGYQFSQDWFSHNIRSWEKILQPLAGQADINAVEIGSFEGMSTCWLLDHILTHPTARITCIDPDFREFFHTNLVKTQAAEKVDKRVGLSQDVLGTLPPDSYNFAYIDGNHLALFALQDALLAWNLVKIGGIIIFDDYNWTKYPPTSDKHPRKGIDTFLSLVRPDVEVVYEDYQISIKKVGHTVKFDALPTETGDAQPYYPWSYYFSLGLLLANQGDLDGSVAAHQKAVARQPDQAWCYHSLGGILAKQGNLEEAVKAYEKAIEIQPDQSWSHHDLADVLVKQGQLDKAALAYQKALNLDPDHFWTYQSLGNVLEKQGKLNKAYAAYSKAIALRPDQSWTHQGLGNVLARQGKFDKAMAAYRKAIEIDPHQPWFHHCLGLLLTRKGKLDEAVAVHRQAVQLQPDQAWFHYGLGEALFKQGKEEAIEAYRRASELQPGEAAFTKGLELALSKKR